jgi:hypothetical protein
MRCLGLGFAEIARSSRTQERKPASNPILISFRKSYGTLQQHLTRLGQQSAVVDHSTVAETAAQNKTLSSCGEADLFDHRPERRQKGGYLPARSSTGVGSLDTIRRHPTGTIRERKAIPH